MCLMVGDEYYLVKRGKVSILVQFTFSFSYFNNMSLDLDEIKYKILYNKCLNLRTSY